MARLVAPHSRFQDSFLAAADEFLVSGNGLHYAGLTLLAPSGNYRGEAYTMQQLKDLDVFETYTRRLQELALPRTWRPTGIVASTALWWVEGDEFLGRLSIRHELTTWLLEYGGHIGYAVRPSARGAGHATAMLGAALPVAAELGLVEVLVTCDDTNPASRRVIEANGGVFEDQRGDKLRYWIDTRSMPTADHAVRP